jgi:hypothetical protein
VASRQLNIRLDAAATEEFEAHAFLRRVQPAALAREIILDFLRDNGDEPGLQAAMESRADHDRVSRQGAKVTPLRPKK